MTIRVHTRDPHQEDTIPGGEGYRITRKGNLIIWGAHHHTIATYAPGAWASICQDQQAQ